jgi:RNA polymerase sigma-70 factor (ECF subfamily)
MVMSPCRIRPVVDRGLRRGAVDIVSPEAAPAADDARLLARARSGDAGAFERLVTAHSRRAWAVCYRITGNAHDAEDALQDALIAAWQHLDKFRGDARFGTWLHRIAANAALALLRRRRDLVMDELPVVAGEAGHPGDDHAERFAEADRVEAALRTLPEDFRVAIVLREYGDLTYAEIAAHQGVPVQTVKSRLNRARTALAELLRPAAG